jgi:hypothetical protein
MINQKAAVRETNTINIRSLQSHCIFFVGSIFQPDNTREVSPERIAIRLKIDETRNKNAQAFERSGRCDRTRMLRILPTEPKRNTNNPKYRLSSIEILFKLTIKVVVFDDISNAYV